ncbi:MAG: DUF881 domain-containing protein [Thermacetogeniaceae bacterium]|nr:DUF881 domain-containing protein [Syntrophomonadaceae bacterium]
MNKLQNWKIPVFITFILLGVLITVQFRTQQTYLRELSQQSTDDLLQMLSRNDEEITKLEQELIVLDQKLRAVSTDVSTGENLTKELQQDILKQKTAIGLMPVKGPGITITIGADSPIMYLDLIDIINELWNAQAEAIAINEHRVTSWSKIHWSGENNMAVTVNGNKITFPCVITAIGDPNKLEEGLRLMGGVLDDLAIYNIYPVINKEESLEIPAAEIPNIRHMKPKIES